MQSSQCSGSGPAGGAVVRCVAGRKGTLKAQSQGGTNRRTSSSPGLIPSQAPAGDPRLLPKRWSVTMAWMPVSSTGMTRVGVGSVSFPGRRRRCPLDAYLPPFVAMRSLRSGCRYSWVIPHSDIGDKYSWGLLETSQSVFVRTAVFFSESQTESKAWARL